jgi:hypothetical protein
MQQALALGKELLLVEIRGAFEGFEELGEVTVLGGT